MIQEVGSGGYVSEWQSNFCKVLSEFFVQGFVQGFGPSFFELGFVQGFVNDVVLEFVNDVFLEFVNGVVLLSEYFFLEFVKGFVRVFCPGFGPR